MAEKDNKKGLERLLSLFEQPRDRKPAKDLRIGLAGGGPLLGAVARVYAGLGLNEPPALYLPGEKNGAAIAGSQGLELFTDAAEFSQRVDAVEVFNLADERLEFITGLLKEGKHVSLQKPFARSIEEAETLTRAARRADAVLYINEYPLFYEPYMKLKELIDAMEIGEVCAIRFRSNLAGGGGTGPAADMLKGREYFFHPAFDRFALAIHLLGGVDSVICYANSMKPEQGGQAIVGFKYKAAGCYGAFELTHAPGTTIRTDCIPCDDQVEVAGTDGIIWVNHFHGKMTEEPWIEVRRGKKHYTMGIGSDMAVEWKDSMRASVCHFLECTKGRRPKFSLRDASKALKFQLAAMEAAENGEEVKV